jgi:hypothetical protein
MAEILAFARPISVCDPETLILLGSAYDKALSHLGIGPLIDRDAIAVRILEMASRGERDPERLHNGAIRSRLSA